MPIRELTTCKGTLKLSLTSSYVAKNVSYTDMNVNGPSWIVLVELYDFHFFVWRKASIICRRPATCHSQLLCYCPPFDVYPPTPIANLSEHFCVDVRRCQATCFSTYHSISSSLFLAHTQKRCEGISCASETAHIHYIRAE